MVKFNPKLYEILGRLPHDTSQKELKKAYRTFAKIYHPDKNPDDLVYAKEMMGKLNEAYEILSDPAKREEYNKKLWEHNKAIKDKEEEIIRNKQKQEQAKTNSQKQHKEPVSGLGTLAGAALILIALGLLIDALSDKK